MELLGAEHARFGRFGPFVVERRRLAAVLVLASVAGIALAIASIGHRGIDPLRG